MNNAELIKALRYCPYHGCASCHACDENGHCLYYGTAGLMTAAADALEAADKRIAELEAQIARGKDGMRCKFAVDHGGGLVECMGYRKVCCGKQRYDTNDDGSINIVECIDVKGEQEDER